MPNKPQPRRETRAGDPAPGQGQDAGQRQVRVQREHQTLPRQPNDRDESADSANEQTDNSRTMGLQAKKDLDRGLQDTSMRGTMEATARHMDAAPEPPPGGNAPVAPDATATSTPRR